MVNECLGVGSQPAFHSEFEDGDPLPHLQRVGILEPTVLQAFQWAPAGNCSENCRRVPLRFNKLQHTGFFENTGKMAWGIYREIHMLEGGLYYASEMPCFQAFIFE